MRIGVVISTYRRWGGLERVSGEWARGLAARGHDLTVFSQTAEPGPGDEPITFVPVGGMRSPIAARAATFPRAVTKSVRRASLDLVVSFGCSVLIPAVVRLHGAHAPWWEIANRNVPATSVEGLRRRLNPHHRVILKLERRVLGSGLPLAVLAAADVAAADIKRFYPRSAPLVEVVPDGIDLESFAFDPAGRESLRTAWNATDSFVVLTVATEVRRKGLDTLFRAFRRVMRERSDAVLVIAGTANRDAVANLAREFGIEAHVRVAGFVPDIAAAYSAADLLAFPTIYEHWGLPIVESLACGTPVVASALAGASQGIEDGRTGFLIRDPFDESDVATSVLRGLRLDIARDECRATVEPMAWPRVLDLVEKALIRARERAAR
ncbi:MAG: glycosyltransferase family 4 protein [Actinomycetota bacterium]|nr:glycosyltransferase family 4 protein [Actinomycetota bacterium]